jgi:hypothetical protein
MSSKETETYPSNIKLYQKQMIIGQGAFGSVRIYISHVI